MNPKVPSLGDADLARNSNRARKYWSNNSHRLCRRKMQAASYLGTLLASVDMWKRHQLLAVLGLVEPHPG